MDFAQARIDVINWITSFVEQPHPALNNWPPCPFARRARLAGEFDLRQGIVDPYTDLMEVDLCGRAVIAYVYDRNHLTAQEFVRQVEQVNQDCLIARDIIALADHPDVPEEVMGVSMNQGTYAITFVQSLGKLNQFARSLDTNGYYHNWPEEYLKELFQFREDPRP